MMLKISDASLLLCDEKKYKTRVLNISSLIPHIRGYKVCHPFKDIKTQLDARIYDKFMFQRHENRGTKALDALESCGWTTFQPFYHGEKRRSCAKRVRETREWKEGENNRGRSLDGPFKPFPPFFSSYNEILRDEKNLLWQGVIARLGVVREKVLVTRCNPKMALNASSRSKLWPSCKSCKPWDGRILKIEKSLLTWVEKLGETKKV